MLTSCSICVFGTSPKYLGTLKSMGIKPRKSTSPAK